METLSCCQAIKRFSRRKSYGINIYMKFPELEDVAYQRHGKWIY